MRSTGYKVLGFLVWQEGKFYLRRRMRGMGSKAAIAGVGAVAVGVGIVALRQQRSESE